MFLFKQPDQTFKSSILPVKYTITVQLKKSRSLSTSSAQELRLFVPTSPLSLDSLEALTTMHPGFPPIRSVPDHDQLAIALMLREKENLSNQPAIASREAHAYRKSVLRSIKTVMAHIGRKQ
ncbi:hypothetical protein PISL3812_09512 [Talaromyces islandicus]|uniref:Uncharacterized protein n=1 Tax=Talaromyces islandicus TaxID=28573 RepID=A0A0U1MAX8_TALIS|nr:hypothetical protein PISL3812_09512 [Talaromyces islandicus]